MFKTVSVVGGDLRQLTLAKELAADGYSTYIYGFDNGIAADGITQVSELKHALGCDIIVLPVPVSFDDQTINTPYSDRVISTDELISGIDPNSIVFGGRISEALARMLGKRGIKHCDYMDRDELAIRNAVPTALTKKQQVRFTAYRSSAL
ncbi:MAG: hypothetical protein IJH37_03570 [Clostridia bacterium]|nr:hypothetical protein [Clostridia bacterium]